jgi:hypothetical protein
VLSPVNGAIYGFPAHADAVLKIQPETGEVTTIGDCHLEGFQYKWLGGAIDPVSQCIYCIPSNANCVLKIDPRTDTVSMFGELSSLKNKWQVTDGNPVSCCT